MAKNVIIRNVSYNDVPYVDVPIQNSQELAHYIDTSDATLDSAAKLPNGVTAYADGVKYTGNAAERTSSDMTASGADVTAPAGFYAATATKSVASGSATAPATVSGTGASVSTGTNTVTFSKNVSVTPQVTAGYVATGTAGTSAVSLTASIPTKSAATITPGTSNQEIAEGTYLTGKQTIQGDANLQPSSIVAGTSIFGVAGNVQVPVIVQDSTTHGLTIS